MRLFGYRKIYISEKEIISKIRIINCGRKLKAYLIH